jgi:hypothetical protein
MTLPCGVTGSLRPAFAPVRSVDLTVKLPYAFALYGWFPISLREPSCASVTFWEATAPVKLPTRQCPRSCRGAELEVQNNQGGISRMAPSRPESRLQSLPPILRRLSRTSLPSCSKGSRGLSVLPRVEGIFTPSTISLSR